MGFLAHIYVYMDAHHQGVADPKKFGEDLLAAMREASAHRGPVTICVGNHGNGATVIGVRHADDETVLVHKGNCVVDVLSEDFRQFLPEVAEEFLKSAEWSIKTARKSVWRAEQEKAGLLPQKPKPRAPQPRKPQPRKPRR